jgi:hypothetical protein
MSERLVQTKRRRPATRAILSFLFVATTFLFVGAEAPAEPDIFTGRQLVRGYIAVAPTARSTTDLVAVVAPTPLSADIFLPDVEVFARNAANNETVGPSITDLSGRFTLQLKGPAKYEI